MTASGYCPFATSVKIPIGNYQIGNDPTLAVALHIVNGSLASCINHFRSAASGVSAHFVIGQNGSLYQFVSIHDTAYAQGLSYDGTWYTNRSGEGRVNVSPTWLLLKPGMAINRHVISIENEGKPGEPRTAAHMATLIRLLKWIAEQTKRVYVVGMTLIGHSMLDTVNRAYCPGSAFNLQEIAMSANKPTEPALPGGTVPVDPTLRAYWERSGGLWQPDKYCLGYGITPLINGIQRFERGALRLNPDGTIDSLLLKEAVALL